MNGFRTFLLMAALVAIFGGLGLLLAGRAGLLLALAVAAAMNLYAWWHSDSVVLRMHQAREVGPDHRLARIVAPLAARAGLPMPRVWLIEQPQPNAFATGRDPQHAAVAATTGLLAMLDEDEIAAVMAHELAHVRNRDTLLMTMTATFAGAISMLGSYAFFTGGDRGRGNPLLLLLAVVVAPFAAMLVQMAISRGREYAARQLGAEISGRPLQLASALRKLQHASGRIANPVAARNPAVAALYIIKPWAGGVRDSLFGTHPSTANRIMALEAMAAVTAPPGRGHSAIGRNGLPRHSGRRNPWA